MRLLDRIAEFVSARERIKIVKEMIDSGEYVTDRMIFQIVGASIDKNQENFNNTYRKAEGLANDVVENR